MQSLRHLTCLIGLATIAACAPSPLWTGEKVRGTGGEVPRDERGEPLWSAIKPPPPPPPPAPTVTITPEPPVVPAPIP